MNTLIPAETEFLNKGKYHRTKKTLDLIRSNYIRIHESSKNYETGERPCKNHRRKPEEIAKTQQLFLKQF